MLILPTLVINRGAGFVHLPIYSSVFNDNYVCVPHRRKENLESVAKVLKGAQEVQEHQAVLVALVQ